MTLIENPFTEAFDHLMAESVTGKTPWIYESPDGGDTIYRYERGTDPLNIAVTLQWVTSTPLKSIRRITFGGSYRLC